MVVEELSPKMREKVRAKISVINTRSYLVGLVVCSDGQYMVSDGLDWSIKHHDYLLCLDIAIAVIVQPTKYKDQAKKILNNNPAKNPIPRIGLTAGQKWT